MRPEDCSVIMRNILAASGQIAVAVSSHASKLSVHDAGQIDVEEVHDGLRVTSSVFSDEAKVSVRLLTY